MTDLPLPDELVTRLRALADREQRPVEEVVANLLDYYEPELPLETETELSDDETPSPDPLVGLVGLLDEYTQETDLSTTVRETLKQYTHPKYGWTRRGRTD